MSGIFQYKTNKVEKKQVYYEGTDTLRKGYLLCYNQDTTTDMNGATIADGLACNGKYLRVEKPATANIPYFAGVVAPESDGITGPAWITVVEPTGGPMVQVYSDADDDAIIEALWLQNGSYLAGSSGVAKLGIPVEAVDRSVTNGLILCRLGMVFMTSAEGNTLSDQVASDAKVFSDTIFSVETYLSNSIDSVEKLCSDAAVAASNSAVSVELACSDATVVASNAVVTISNKLVSEHASIAARATTCGAAMVALISDVNYSDIYALASDVQTAMKAISDFLVALSNEYIS
jgi:hypothetical protein